MDRISIPDSVASANLIEERADRDLVRKNRKKNPKPTDLSQPEATSSETDGQHELDELA